MAFTVEFWAFSKKENSTKQPTSGSGISYTNVLLKDETSILNPVLKVAVASMPVPTVAPVNTMTYCYIAKFGRYYFVTDWVYNQGVWECSLAVDVLASFKTNIGAMSEYVLRSSNTSNGAISDVLYPATTNYTLTESNVNLNLETDGFYVLGVINNSSTVSEGAISYYIMTGAQLANIKSYLMSNTFLQNNNLTNLSEISADMIKVLYNPYQYIVSCKYFPFPFPTYAPDVSGIEFGWWSLPYAAKRMAAGGYEINRTSASYTMPAHPQAARGTYLNHAPYTELVFYHPLTGTVPLDTNKIDAGETIIVDCAVETITGYGYINIRKSGGGTNKLLYQTYTQLAMDIPLAQMNIDTINVARTAIDTAGNVASAVMSLNPVGAITSAASGILNTLEASAPVLQSGGTPGTKANYTYLGKMMCYQRNVVNDDNSNKGRPLCQVKQISTIPGFITCLDAHIDLPCFDGERQKIKSYMETGFYYE